MVEGDNHVNVAEIMDRQGITGEQATRANEGPAARPGLSSVQPARVPIKRHNCPGKNLLRTQKISNRTLREKPQNRFESMVSLRSLQNTGQ